MELEERNYQIDIPATFAGTVYCVYVEYIHTYIIYVYIPWPPHYSKD